MVKPILSIERWQEHALHSILYYVLTMKWLFTCDARRPGNNRYDILPQYESKTLTEKLENNWFDELKRYPDRASLFHTTIRTMRWIPLIIGSFYMFKVSWLNWFINSYFNIEISNYYPAIINFIFDGFLWTMSNYVNSISMSSCISQFFTSLCASFGNHRVRCLMFIDVSIMFY
jgi:hypothetical protein